MALALPIQSSFLLPCIQKLSHLSPLAHRHGVTHHLQCCPVETWLHEAFNSAMPDFIKSILTFELALVLARKEWSNCRSLKVSSSRRASQLTLSTGCCGLELSRMHWWLDVHSTWYTCVLCASKSWLLWPFSLLREEDDQECGWACAGTGTMLVFNKVGWLHVELKSACFVE